MTIASGQIAQADDILKHATASGHLRLVAQSELTIASGAITVNANHYNVDTEGDAASDDLDTITAGSEVADGFLLVLRPNNAARTVVIKHNTGNILCAGDVDIPLNDTHDQCLLVYDSSLTKWRAGTGNNIVVGGRQGGASADWATSGTTSYFPGGAKLQFGTFSITCTSGQTKASSSVTLPEAYAAGAPIVLATVKNNTFTDSDDVVVTANGNTGVPPISGITFTLYPTAAATFSDTQAVIVYWLAIGPS